MLIPKSFVTQGFGGYVGARSRGTWEHHKGSSFSK